MFNSGEGARRDHSGTLGIHAPPRLRATHPRLRTRTRTHYAFGHVNKQAPTRLVVQKESWRAVNNDILILFLQCTPQ